jgi:hypothetical protein
VKIFDAWKGVPPHEEDAFHLMPGDQVRFVAVR